MLQAGAGHSQEVKCMVDFFFKTKCAFLKENVLIFGVTEEVLMWLGCKNLRRILPKFEVGVGSLVQSVCGSLLVVSCRYCEICECCMFGNAMLVSPTFTINQMLLQKLVIVS